MRRLFGGWPRSRDAIAHVSKNTRRGHPPREKSRATVENVVISLAVSGVNRIVPLLRGILWVLAITAVGIVPPTILDEIGVRRTPRVPWVGPIAIAWMTFAWWLLNRPGTRRDHLSAKRLPPRKWLLALSILLAGTAAMHALRILALRIFNVADVRTAALAGCSTSVLLSSFVVTALSAAVFEEAAYRGYLIRELQPHYGWKWAIGISALLFTAAHLTRGRNFLVVLPLVFGFAWLYGAVAWRAGSIIPGIAVHFGYNFVRLLGRWRGPEIHVKSPLLVAAGLVLLSAASLLWGKLLPHDGLDNNCQ